MFFIGFVFGVSFSILVLVVEIYLTRQNRGIVQAVAKKVAQSSAVIKLKNQEERAIEQLRNENKRHNVFDLI